MSKGAILQIERLMRTEPLAKVFSHLDKALSRDFEEGFKVARINYFKVYELAVRTLQSIGKRAMELQLELSEMPSSVEAALHGIDEEVHRRNTYISYGMVAAFLLFEKMDKTSNRGERKLQELPLLPLTQEAIGEVWGDVALESLYWKSI